MIELLGEESCAVTALEIDQRLPRVGRATVYRTLEQLEQLGVVRHVHLGHGPSLYHLVGGGEREYLACEGCGRVTSVDPSELDPIRDRVRKQFGYEARFGHFPIVGLCRHCAGEGKPGRRAAADHAHSHGDYVHSHPHPQGPHEH